MKKIVLVKAFPASSFPCEGRIYVKRKLADKKDFGYNRDTDSENPEIQEYYCMHNEFVPKLPAQAILDKYKITLDEYYKITEYLQDIFLVGACDWCD